MIRMMFRLRAGLRVVPAISTSIMSRRSITQSRSTMGEDSINQGRNFLYWYDDREQLFEGANRVSEICEMSIFVGRSKSPEICLRYRSRTLGQTSSSSCNHLQHIRTIITTQALTYACPSSSKLFVVIQGPPLTVSGRLARHLKR